MSGVLGVAAGCLAFNAVMAAVTLWFARRYASHGGRQ
jgi:hypothetical protein